MTRGVLFFRWGDCSGLVGASKGTVTKSLIFSISGASWMVSLVVKVTGEPGGPSEPGGPGTRELGGPVINHEEEDDQEDTHEIDYAQTKTDTSDDELEENIGSTSHGKTITQKETRALSETRKIRLNKKNLGFEVDDCSGRIVGDDSQRFITKGGCVMKKFAKLDGTTWKKQPDLLKRDIITKSVHCVRTRQYLSMGDFGTDNQEKDEKQSQNDKTGLGMEKTVKDKAKSKPESQSSQKVNRKVNWSKSKSTQVNPGAKVQEI
ncbi:hypothetical protein Tco_1391351 [Tanacetum coccineum]